MSITLYYFAAVCYNGKSFCKRSFAVKLYLIGHDYKYAAEQMMLSLYPAERPEYPEGKPEGDRVELSLRKGKKFITCVCRIAKDGKMFVGRSAFNAELAADDLSRDRLCSRIIKNAFYRAALRSGHSRPAWGSLTGVRPGKLFCAMLDETGEPDTATRRFITEYDVSPERAKLCRDTSPARSQEVWAIRTSACMSASRFARHAAHIAAL